ncbi:MAG: hypothetical protein JNK66_03390 [Chitinophagales bacterium]|nr:hypothetical protein [Chitinophagales bacterium]
MNPILRNILTVLAGLVIGGIANMLLIQISGYIIPPPEGADVKTIEGLQSSIHLFQPKHFLMPFLAHALGTLVGAAITTALAANRALWLCVLVASFSFVGGVVAVKMLPAPMWFNVTDLTLAYFPMGWLGYKTVTAIKGK